MLLFVGERTMHDDDGAAAERRAYAAVAEGEALRLPPVPLPAEELLPASPEGVPPLRKRRVDHPLVGVGVGLASGVLGGALNEAGPPVVIFLALKEWGKDDVKATLQLYFTLVSLGVVTMMASRGILLPRHLYYDAVGLPAAALGAGLGICLYNRIDQHLFGRLLVGAMLVGGVCYISHATIELLAEAHALPDLDWFLRLYVEADAAQDAHVRHRS